MDSQKINELLDKSCADALVAWGRERTISEEKALDAMRELNKLGSLQKPNYDCEYVPPAYVVIYQIKHINMAWRVLSSLKEKRSLGTTSRRDSLRIVDFGAGTSAGRIGAALMVAEAIEEGGNIDRLHIDEIDTSTPMQGMGKLVWRAFTQKVQSGEFADTALACAVKVIDFKQHRDWTTVKKDDCETWLTAFHVIYPDTDDLTKVINRLYQRVNPIAGAFSCYEGNSEKMEAVFPPFDIRESLPDLHISDKCPTAHISNRAVNYGFWTVEQRNLRPFLQVKDCAILLGSNIPF